MANESAESISVGEDEMAGWLKELATINEKLTLWEAEDKYSKSYQKYKEAYLRIIYILETWCREPRKDMIGCHVGDVIRLLHSLVDLSASVCVDYMIMRSIKEEEDGIQHSQTDEGATGDGGTGHTS